MSDEIRSFRDVPLYKNQSFEFSLLVQMVKDLYWFMYETPSASFPQSLRIPIKRL